MAANHTDETEDQEESLLAIAQHVQLFGFLCSVTTRNDQIARQRA